MTDPEITPEPVRARNPQPAFKRTAIINPEMTPVSRLHSPMVPILLFAISLAIVLVWQIVTIASQNSAMSEARVQFAGVLAKREDLVKQSNDIQAKLQALVVDLLELAKTDEKAKAVVQKYNIQQTPPPGAPPK